MSLIAFFSLILLGTLVVDAHSYPTTPAVHIPIPQSGLEGRLTSTRNCLSWRLAGETNNIHGWYSVPKECGSYIGQYMMEGQYEDDCSAVTDSAYDFVKTLKINKHKDVWIFDIDETTLSNIPYFARPEIGFGIHPFNTTSFNEWLVKAEAPAIPSAPRFYKRLLRLGVKIVFLTGTAEQYKLLRMGNLKRVGYRKWDRLIFKQLNQSHMNAVEYKSMERTNLEKMGYRIIGNMGDQWSDLYGPTPGMRTFKLPNPLYYVI